MRRLASAGLVLVAVAAVAGCGASKKPLALDQRLLKNGDLPGFKCPRGVGNGLKACRRQLNTLASIGNAGGAFINDPRGARKRLQLQKAGILRGFSEQLFNGNVVRGSSNVPPSGRPSVVTSMVVQFRSDSDAKAFLAKLFPESLAPCPTQCQVVKSEFPVSGIKDARGAELVLSVGPVKQRFRGFRVEFADGPFVYGLSATGDLGAVSESSVVDAAKTLDKRVKGHPPPGS